MDYREHSIQDILPPITPINTKVTSENFKRVYFDLETGSLFKETDILQIAAVSGTQKFNQYITPVGYLDPKASEVTGLTFEEGALMLHGNPVESIPIKDALNMFITWLNDIGTCLLIAHNAFRFDVNHIRYHVESCNLTDSFISVVCGFSDTLTIMKKNYPNRSSYKQSTLVSEILKESYEAHNALDDVISLRKLIEVCGITDEEMKSTGVSSCSVFQKQKNIDNLKDLINSNVLSNEMAMKTAVCGVQMHNLKMSIEQEGFEGLNSLLSEIVNGKPRVTRNSKIIKRVFDFLSEN